jgi:hypothetical protein
MPYAVNRTNLADGVTLGLGGAGNIASAARIVDSQFERLTTAHRFEPDLGVGPVERTFHATEIEAKSVRVACVFGG